LPDKEVFLVQSESSNWSVIVSFISYLLHEVVFTADQEYVGIFVFSPCECTDFLSLYCDRRNVGTIVSMAFAWLFYLYFYIVHKACKLAYRFLVAANFSDFSELSNVQIFQLRRLNVC